MIKMAKYSQQIFVCIVQIVHLTFSFHHKSSMASGQVASHIFSKQATQCIAKAHRTMLQFRVHFVFRSVFPGFPTQLNTTHSIIKYEISWCFNNRHEWFSQWLRTRRFYMLKCQKAREKWRLWQYAKRISNANLFLVAICDGASCIHRCYWKPKFVKLHRSSIQLTTFCWLYIYAVGLITNEIFWRSGVNHIYPENTMQTYPPFSTSWLEVLSHPCLRTWLLSTSIFITSSWFILPTPKTIIPQKSNSNNSVRLFRNKTF
jgi:hypothetical protein